MKRIDTPLQGCCILEPKVFGDARGWFYESYSRRAFADVGIETEFIQDNRSFSAAAGTLRGLHCQIDPAAQTKLITCVRGAILDVVVDVREGSPSYLRCFAAELTAENKRMLYIPKGFLHGFVTKTDDVEVFYKVDAFYSPDHDRSVRFDDPQFAIDWGVETPILSQKDTQNVRFCDSDIRFFYDKGDS